jgi:hypothetical protein
MLVPSRKPPPIEIEILLVYLQFRQFSLDLGLLILSLCPDPEVLA